VATGEQNADREVIYTGTMVIRAGDAPDAADQAKDIADRHDGYLASSTAELEGDREVRVSLRVPSEAFDAVMAELAELGTVESREIDSQDVTDQVVDLQGRLENAQTSADRLRDLLVDAQQITNIITIEERLTQRETEIEALTGQLEVLEDQVTLATVDVTFTEGDVPAVSDDVPGFLAALRSGVVALGNVALVAAAAVGFALPFVPLVLVAWWLVRWVRRRGRGANTSAGSTLLPPPSTPMSADVGVESDVVGGAEAVGPAGDR